LKINVLERDLSLAKANIELLKAIIARKDKEGVDIYEQVKKISPMEYKEESDNDEKPKAV